MGERGVKMDQSGSVTKVFAFFCDLLIKMAQSGIHQIQNCTLYLLGKIPEETALRMDQGESAYFLLILVGHSSI